MPFLERLIAALADRYRIERELGAGGMATVYLAEDLKHDRKVAVKVLKPELAAVLGAERFVVEIKTTAALSHPHILPLFDSGEADGFLFYVMPFVDGETIRDRLNRETQLGVDEAVRITTEIADALQYAHAHGVIHRDIKPENILLQGGRPMVADFGIALAVSAAAGGRMTETGLSLGTPHYMSPEQATAEKEITGRSDVYSLASVLYEMLAGEPPHMGNSAQQIIMKIITDRARLVTELRQSVPPHVAAAVAKALEKLPADRFESAEEFSRALTNKGFATTTGATAYGVAAGSSGRGRSALLRTALGVVIGAAVTALAMSVWLRPERAVRRLVVEFPVSSTVTNSESFSRFLPMRDGRHFVISGEDGSLAVRSREESEFRVLAGTAGGFLPTQSPDGREIAFISQNGAISAVPLNGGPVRVLADSGIGVWGVTWSADGYVYASSNSPANVGIVRVPARGAAADGEPEPVTRVASAGATGHIFPVALPDGRGILFTIQPGTSTQQSAIAVTRPGSGEYRELMRGLAARYSPTGHLLVLTPDGTLIAAPFDLKTLELTGDPVPVLQGLVPPLAYGGEGELHLTDDGTLWYQSGERAQDLRPVWVTRRGEETPVRPDWMGVIGAVAISPDGRRLAYSENDGSQERLWLTSLDGRGTPFTLLEREGGVNFRPSWSADGRTLAWISNRSGPNAAYFRAVDGQAKAQPLLPPSVTLGVWEVAYARRDPWVLYRVEGNGSDIFAIRPGVDSVGIGLVTTPAIERQPSLSPDARWLAYASDEDGISNIYVRPFPNVDDAVWQITTEGGVSPRWSPNGRELFYVDMARRGPNVPSKMMAVQIRPGDGFAWSSRQALFETADYVDANNSFLWDVSPLDGRFLMLKRLDSGKRPSLVMAENFTVELLEKLKR